MGVRELLLLSLADLSDADLWLPHIILLPHVILLGPPEARKCDVGQCDILAGVT
jgi:hypothetical protein